MSLYSNRFADTRFTSIEFAKKVDVDSARRRGKFLESILIISLFFSVLIRLSTFLIRLLYSI